MHLQACDADVEGYSLFFRVQEIWPLVERQQQFHNWYTKLWLGCTLGLLWLMALVPGRHSPLMFQHSWYHPGERILQQSWPKRGASTSTTKVGYKGSQVQVDERALRLSFDALSLPGFFFTDTWPKVSRSNACLLTPFCLRWPQPCRSKVARAICREELWRDWSC